MSKVWHVTGVSLALTLGLGVGVSLLGWLLGWHTALQFSNGLFVAGSVVIIVGLTGFFGGVGARADFKWMYVQSVGDRSLAEQSKLWLADALRGYNIVATSTLSGVLLIGLSILVDQIFG
ncbi:MAG: hypothetical protein ACP5QU_03060 [Anaerolineae bacterium]